MLLAGVFPWTPLLFKGLFRRSLYRGRIEKFLLAWVLFGFVFFSVSRNKLPGYLLPLLPALAILMAVSLADMKDARWLLTITAASLGLIPAIAGALPQILVSGASHSKITFNIWATTLFLGLATLPWLLRRDWTVGVIAGLLACFVTFIVWQTYLLLDQSVSASGPIGRLHRNDSVLCADSGIAGPGAYGLDYYAGRIVPNCNHPP